MPRKPRTETPGAIHHVTARGADDGVIFHDESDYRACIRFLGITCRHHEWRCIAYCLMGDHLQLVVETQRGNLGAGMRYLAASCARRQPFRLRSAGRVFQDRFQSLPVNRDAYLLEVVRYVLLDPVRAGRCRRARDWRWSSVHEGLGLAPVPCWMNLEIAYELLGPADGRGAERLGRLLEAGGNGRTTSRRVRPGGV